MLKSIIFGPLILLALAQAQTVTPLRNVGCPSTTEPLVVLTVPVSVSAVTIPVPFCVGLGAGIKYNATSSKLEVDPAALPLGTGLRYNTTTAKLEVDPAALPPSTPANVPRQALYTLVLGTLPQQPGITQFGAPLPYTPAPGTHLVVHYVSSRVGGDITDFVPFVPDASNPKMVQFLLPAHRPLVSTDVLKILYWTFDPPA